jgi:antitoxin component YwqK of YwqJK toxin-antitoxin module
MISINIIIDRLRDVEIVKTSYINCSLNSVKSLPCKVVITPCAIHQYHYCNSYLHDNLQEPAVQIFADGHLLEMNRYKLGRLHDLDEFNPAVITYLKNTKNIITISRYKNGLANNSKNGLPARQEFYSNGNIRSCSYYENNKLNNFHSIPAYRYWNQNGYMITSENYFEGLKI